MDAEVLLERLGINYDRKDIIVINSYIEKGGNNANEVLELISDLPLWDHEDFHTVELWLQDR